MNPPAGRRPGGAVRRLATAGVRLSGRTTHIDPDAPSGLLVSEIVRRLVELTRGVLRLQTPVFLGARVRIRGRRRLTLGRFVSVGERTVLDCYARDGVRIGEGSRIGRHGLVTCTSHLSRLGAGFEMGRRSGLGDYVHVGCAGGVRIGDDVIGGSFISFHSQEHVIERTDIPIRDQGAVEGEIVVGDDVWLGHRCTLLAGTRIGTGSVVAAGAVVKGEFPPYSIIGGVPAKVLRSREPDERQSPGH